MKTEPYPFALRALLVVSLGAIGTLGLGLVLGGAAEPLPLADPGVVVRLGQPITKLVLNLSMATAIGALVLASFAANDQERSRLQPVASWAAAVWLFAAAANFVMTYLSASGSMVCT